MILLLKINHVACFITVLLKNQWKSMKSKTKLIGRFRQACDTGAEFSKCISIQYLSCLCRVCFVMVLWAVPSLQGHRYICTLTNYWPWWWICAIQCMSNSKSSIIKWCTITHRIIYTAHTFMHLLCTFT